MPQTAAARVLPVDIVQEMQQAYLDYAMSVIVARALPDAREMVSSPCNAGCYMPCTRWTSPPTNHTAKARASWAKF